MAERLKRIGTGTILLPNRPGIAQTAAIVGKKVKDCIADAFLQNTLLVLEEYSQS